MTTNLTKIRVVVVDDNPDTLNNLKKLLYFEKDIEIVATATSGEDGISRAVENQPDVVLMDINMPGMDGISASEAIATRVPSAQVVMMSVQAESDYLRRAMLAGAREFLIKPFSSEQLANTVRTVHHLGASQRTAARPVAPPPTPHAAPPPPLVKDRTPTAHSFPQVSTLPTVAPSAPPPPPPAEGSGKQGKVFVIFSGNGGVGRSTVATNLAIALKDETKGKVALVDCSLRFGDIGVLLNLNMSHTIADICSAEGGVDTEILADLLTSHPTGVKVLLAPPSPELAELVNVKCVRLILTTLREKFDYIVVDTYASLDEITLSVLDLADQILLLTTSEIPSIKNSKLFFEVTEALKYPPEKTLMILNKADPKSNITPQDIQASIKHPVFAVIERDERATSQAAQTGQPFVVNQRNAPATIAMHRLAKMLTRPATESVEAPKPPKKGFLR